MILALLLGCPQEPVEDTGWCVDAPLVTWESYGEAILDEYCQPCHASGARDRHGAPVAVTFDTEAEAWAFRQRIVAVISSDPPIMPPNLPMADEDRYRLQVWLGCDDPAE